MSARDEAQLLGLADAVAESIATPAPVFVDLGLEAFATAVATDGRVMKLVSEPDGGLTLHLAGRSNPVRFDRFQAGALRAAFAELPACGGYVFARGAGRGA